MEDLDSFNREIKFDILEDPTDSVLPEIGSIEDSKSVNDAKKRLIFKHKRKLCTFLAWELDGKKQSIIFFIKLSLLTTKVFECFSRKRKKEKKKKIIRDRHSAWMFISSWDDELFYGQFRIMREDFFTMCKNMKKED